MAKQTKKFGIGSTLKKKIELKPTVSKDIDNIEEKVAKIHSNESKKLETVSEPTPKVQKTKTVTKKAVAKEQKKEEMKRLTIDIPKSLHKRLKSRTAEDEVSIKDLLNKLILKYVSK